MNSITPIGYLAKLAGAATLLAASVAQAAIINGGFETGNLSNWTALGSVSVSTGFNYGVGSVNPDSGSYSALLNSNNISASTLASTMGVSVATLQASNNGTVATNGSLIYQSTTATVGDVFQFRWNFVEQDYLPFDDWAFYGISYNGGPATVTKFASLGTVGPGQGTTINGWQTLNVNITQSGNYTFYFGIVNAIDTGLDSSLWLDGVTAAPPVKAPDSGVSVALLGLALAGLAALRRQLA